MSKSNIILFGILNLIYLLAISPLAVMGSTLIKKGNFPAIISLICAGFIILQIFFIYKYYQEISQLENKLKSSSVGSYE